MAVNKNNHPCFNEKARHQFARIHLPVAPRCNIQCNFCNRLYDCVNESRPGVTSTVLNPYQALAYLQKSLEMDPRISLAGMAGPGDPFATPELTMTTLRLIREHFPQLLLCVASNGLHLSSYVEQLAELQVSHVTVTVNSIDHDIGSRIYSWVRDGKKIYRGQEAATLLLERQIEAVRRLKEAEIAVKINTIIIPTVNDTHVIEVARKMGELGADIMNCMPLYPSNGTVFSSIPEPSAEMVRHIHAQAAPHLAQMNHCTRCRADAVGLLGEAMSAEIILQLQQASGLPLNPGEDRPYVAVASREGVLVNQHLGEASQLLIYAQTGDEFHLIESRAMPKPGTGLLRWIKMSGLLKDCRALLVGGAGQNPREVLTQRGLKVIETEGLIEEALSAVFEGIEIRQLKVREGCGCGITCSGSATGCM